MTYALMSIFTEAVKKLRTTVTALIILCNFIQALIILCNFIQALINLCNFIQALIILCNFMPNSAKHSHILMRSNHHVWNLHWAHLEFSVLNYLCWTIPRNKNKTKIKTSMLQNSQDSIVIDRERERGWRRETDSACHKAPSKLLQALKNNISMSMSRKMRNQVQVGAQLGECTYLINRFSFNTNICNVLFPWQLSSLLFD